MRFALSLCALLTAAFSPVVQAESLSFEVAQVFLEEDDRNHVRAGELAFISGISITSNDARFGGLSGLHVAENREFLAITDQGDRITGQLLHDKEGALIGLGAGNIQRLHNTHDKPLKGKRKSDAEGLAVTPTGSFISFERKHRIWFYPGADPAGKAAQKIKLPSSIKNMPQNGGLESILWLGDNKLLAFSEKSKTKIPHNNRDKSRHFAGIFGSSGDWSPIYLTPFEDYSPTAMTRLASGDVLILERSFSFLRGPAARIRQIEFSKIKPNAILRGREIARLSGSQTVDNMEGISAVMTDQGERIYLVSDDNFNPLQRNLILMFRFAVQDK